MAAASRGNDLKFGVVMAGSAKQARARLLSAACFVAFCGYSDFGLAQTLVPAVEKPKAEKPTKPSARRAAKPQANRAVDPKVANAWAAVPTPTNVTLDTITIVASKTSERAVDALAPVSIVTLGEIQSRQPSKLADVLYNIPGVWMQDRGDEPSTSINIRGLQDFGRVAVVVDGARQNYQRTGHFANGSFFLNPELIGGIDIVRGPTANIYGSGAIGGVASFRTKDIQDVVKPGERWGVDTNTVVGTNSNRILNSAFGGVHVTPDVDVFGGGTYSTQDNYHDGLNTTVSNTANKLSSGLGKITVRPADGHEVKLGGIFQEDLYNVGQPYRPLGLPFATTGALSSGTSVYHTDVKNYTATLGWTYARPEDKMFDWDSKVYWNRTENDQTKTLHNGTAASGNCAAKGKPGNDITGCVGDTRGYTLDTFGFDLHNTTRVETGDFRHAFTYGVDGFQDQVAVFDNGGNSNKTTPAGTRNVGGAFVQWKANYTSLFELISAVRYDNYHLSSTLGSAGGDRFSPKITLGLLPTEVLTPYVSYAEGYRSPSITETLIGGAHVATAPNQGVIFNCPDGSSGYFCFQPNPNLRPEVGKNKEIGVNLKKDGLFTGTDSLRGKFSVYRNDVYDYIDFVGSALQACDNAPGCPPGGARKYYQYQNIAAARIQGFEAEAMYDAKLWYVGVSGSVQSGKNVQTGVGLYSIPPQKVTVTGGVRFLDEKVVLSAMWTGVTANTSIPANFLPGTSYDLVNLYLAVKPTQNVALNFSVENLLNSYYRPYAIPGADAGTGANQNDLIWSSAGTGIVYKAGLKVHFGGA